VLEAYLFDLEPYRFFSMPTFKPKSAFSQLA
jgi:hypothetical protein